MMFYVTVVDASGARYEARLEGRNGWHAMNRMTSYLGFSGVRMFAAKVKESR